MNFLENEFFLLAVTFGIFFLAKLLQKKTGIMLLNPILLTIAILIVFLKMTHISYETYSRLARILPLLSEGMTVPAFLDNVLNRHLGEHGDVLDEMVRTGTRNSR